ncbi:hypothetical protein [Ferviditalea candida]|uniref:Big-1 domain-containing protein n=1 Tax=Ferviditalea candida TaxID=3108399 RepID=A0ABU5ZPF1_9BACL|nr:hypothetical protein [Paenibacillaceae bacterium T2]
MIVEKSSQNGILIVTRTTDNGSVMISNEGYALYVVVSVDKNNVPSDGSVTVTITAEIFDYLDAPQTSDTRNITFEMGGVTDTKPAVNGVATTTFTPGVPGTSVFTITADGCNSAQIEVIAV